MPYATEKCRKKEITRQSQNNLHNHIKVYTLFQPQKEQRYCTKNALIFGTYNGLKGWFALPDAVFFITLTILSGYAILFMNTFIKFTVLPKESFYAKDHPEPS